MCSKPSLLLQYRVKTEEEENSGDNQRKHFARFAESRGKRKTNVTNSEKIPLDMLKTEERGKNSDKQRKFPRVLLKTVERGKQR